MKRELFLHLHTHFIYHDLLPDWCAYSKNKLYLQAYPDDLVVYYCNENIRFNFKNIFIVTYFCVKLFYCCSQ